MKPVQGRAPPPAVESNIKKYFKSSLLPLTKQVSLKSFNQQCFQCKYIFDIIIYNYAICIFSMKI